MYNTDNGTNEQIAIAQKNMADTQRAEGQRPSHEELDAAFAKVQSPLDWKGPIKAPVLEDNLEITLQAIEYFTATKPTATKVMHTIYIVEAAGYRAGPAGDH